MDVLAAYQARGRASLEHVALLLGLPGKLGMSGGQVFDYWKDGRLAEIRAYCETDVFNTYLVWLRFQLVRGHLGAAAYASELARARAWLEERAEPHWREYDAAWARA
jgi:predicted PolB exonuclease-like 3'-5' exonuclease